MMDFWSLFVEYSFGGFYITILMLAFIFLIILMSGGVSIYTAIWFDAIFLFNMCLGNGTWLIVLPVSVIIIFMLMNGIRAFREAYYRGGQ